MRRDRRARDAPTRNEPALHTLIRGLRRPIPLFFSVWVGLFVAATAWAIATPLGGSPDEPAHIIKAASVVRGQFLGEPTDQPAVRSVQVPEGIATAADWPCYAFVVEASASCLLEVVDGSELAEAETSAGLYNPAYYLMVGWPSLLTGNTSAAVLGMRIVGALVVSFFLAAGFSALHRLRPNRVTAFGLAAAVTPMVLFLASAVNPNGLEVASGFALMSALLLVLGAEPLARRWPWLVLIGASGVLLAQSRGLSPLWMAVIAIIALVVTPWVQVLREIRRWAVILTLAVLVFGVLGAVAWTFATGSLGSMGNFPGATDPPRRAFLTMLFRTFDPGLFGYFGWLDTPAPAFVFAMWSFLSIALVIAAIVVARGRRTWALAIAVVALLVVPAVVQAMSVQSSGYIWQGRYALFAYAILVALATAVAATAWPAAAALPDRWRRRLVAWVAGLVVLGHTWALFATLQRYQGGLPVDQVVLHPVWTPPGGLLLWLVVIAAATCFTAWATAVGTDSRDETLVVDGGVERPEASVASA
jgi:Predicted membrane protein (DUF2142)